MDETSGDAERKERETVDLEAAIEVGDPPLGAGDGKNSIKLCVSDKPTTNCQQYLDIEKPPDYESLNVFDGVNLPRQANNLVGKLTIVKIGY